MKYTPLRPAIAMIELIFALVIMGIVLMSAPMLISTATKTTNVALQQEGINEAASRINMILTYAWDQQDTNETCMPPVLHVSAAGDTELILQGTTARRKGVPLTSSSHTFKCNSAEFSASAVLGLELTDGGTKNDMDDFDNNISVATVDATAGGVDYIEQGTVAIATTVSYINDNTDYSLATIGIPAGGAPIGGTTTNIKKIDVNLTSTSTASELNQKKITLHAFSCNIGGYELEHKGL